jgi:hypothetical protein
MARTATHAMGDDDDDDDADGGGGSRRRAVGRSIAGVGRSAWLDSQAEGAGGSLGEGRSLAAAGSHPAGSSPGSTLW